MEEETKIIDIAGRKVEVRVIMRYVNQGNKMGQKVYAKFIDGKKVTKPTIVQTKEKVIETDNKSPIPKEDLKKLKDIVDKMPIEEGMA